MTEPREQTPQLAPKQCSACGASFGCGANAGGRCWCDDLPPLTTPAPAQDCLCPRCLERALAQQR